MKEHNRVRIAMAALGTSLMLGVAGAAFADFDADLDVTVEIAPLVEPGSLALSVASDSVTLTEEGSSSQWRQFTGELPSVTVSDTRSGDEIPAGAAWYVVGSASSFVGEAGQPEISAAHLGWAPRLVAGSDLGLVAAGDSVETILDDGDNAVGLVDQEFLAVAADSGVIVGEGTWSATADLYLRTPVTVEPGSYAAQLTISLFE